MDNLSFFKLLRLSIGISDERPTITGGKEWLQIYETAQKQALVGVIHNGIQQLEKSCQPPMELALTWAVEAETVHELNKLMNEEAARLTQLFKQEGRQTVILKGQANAHLYPDPLSRQPGDIDIWVEGGRKSVIKLLKQMNLYDEEQAISYHHVHLPEVIEGITVEVHFRPSSGNCNPWTNRRLQRYLNEQLAHITYHEKGFYEPPMTFALAMQLAHIQRHFFSTGLGCRQLMDYYFLLTHASDEDRSKVTAILDRCGLRHIAGALMWVLQYIFRLDDRLLLCPPDAYRGKWMLDEIMEGGNFGVFAERMTQSSDIVFFLKKEKRYFQLTRFDAPEMMGIQLNYWKDLFRRIPERIKQRRFSLRK